MKQLTRQSFKSNELEVDIDLHGMTIYRGNKKLELSFEEAKDLKDILEDTNYIFTKINTRIIHA